MNCHEYSIDEIRRLLRQTREDMDENNRTVKMLTESVQILMDGLKDEYELE
jgi:hypothetical protein